MSLIAVRIAFVTLMRARSAGEEKRPVPAPQPDRARELLGQEVELLLEAGGAFGVAPVARLLELFFELLEPSP